MAISAKFVADFSAFESAVQKAQVSLQGFEGNAGKVTRSLNAMSNSLNGTKVIQDATLMARAVEKIGGVSKLTESELKRLGTQAQEAIAKMKAMGEGVPANLQRVADAAKRVGVSMEEMQQGLQRFGSAAKSIGAGLTATITAPLVGAGVGVVKLAMDFESSFAGVRKTVDATDAEFAQMAQQFRNLAKTIPVNVNELNRLGEAAGALGIPKEEIVDFARVMAELGVTTNVTADQAAESIAKIQNIFGAAGKDTEKFASTLVDLGNKGASTEGQILEMATRLASAASAIGITQEKVLGMSAAIANVGIEAEAGGSAMSRVMTEIAVAVSHGGKAVQGFADVSKLSVAEFSRLFKTDASAAIKAFVEGLGHVKEEGGDLILTLEELGFKEIRQSNLLRALAGNYKDFGFSLDTASAAWKTNNALSEEARKRFETTAAQLTLLWNRVKDVGITLGTALLPAVISLVGAFNRLVPVMEGFAQMFLALPGPIQLVAVAFVGIAAAAGPVIYLSGQMAIAAAAVTGMFVAEGVAAGGLSVALRTLAITHLPTFTAAMTTMGTSAAVASTQMTAFGLVLSGLATVAALAGAALAGWALGRTIAAVFDLDTKIANLVARIRGLGDVQAETSGAGQDAIAAAIKRGADASVTFAEAVKYNTEWFAKYNAAIQFARDATTEFVGPVQNLASKNTSLALSIQKANQEIRSLSAAARTELVTAIQSGAFSIEELAKDASVSELAVKLFKAQLTEGGKSAKAFAKDLNETIKEFQAFRSESVTAAKEVAKGLEGPLDVLRQMMKQIALMHDSRIMIRVGITGEQAAGLSGGNLPSRQFLPGSSALPPGAVSQLGEYRAMVQGTTNDLEALSQAFAQFAQVSGGSFGGALQQVGQLVTGINLAKEAVKVLASETASWAEKMAAAATTFGVMMQGFQLLADFAQQGMKQRESVESNLNSELAAFETKFTDARTRAGQGLVLLEEQAAAAGISLDRFYKALERPIRMNTEQAIARAAEIKAAIDEINDALDAYAAKQGLLDEASSLYGPSTADLSETEKHLHAIFDAMTEAGTYSATQLERAYYAWQEALAAAGNTAAQAWLAAYEGTAGMADAAEKAGYQTTEALQKAADKAKELWEYMRDSGQYSAEQVTAAFEAAQKAQDKALGKSSKVMDELRSKRDALQKSIAQEAPEEVMGVIERQQREELKAIERQLQGQMDAATKAAEFTAGESQKAADSTETSYKDAANNWAQFAEKRTGEVRDTVTRHLNDASKSMENDFTTAAVNSKAEIEKQLNAIIVNPIHIKVMWDMSDFPGAPTIPAIPQAHGGDYLVTKPTLFLAGEAGAERATFTPQSASRKSGGDIIELHNHNYLDGVLVSENVVRHMAQDKRGIGTKARRVLGMS